MKLRETEYELGPAIERWDKSKSPPSDVTVLARYRDGLFD
jgi:hypothetical protein